jgi:hypothetical protein
LMREPGLENSVWFAPDSLSLEFGPIHVVDRELDAPIHCGWIGLNVSGPGYPYPWTRRDVLARLENDPHLRQITELCRRTWPVPPEDADSGVRRGGDASEICRLLAVRRPEKTLGLVLGRRRHLDQLGNR